MDVSFTSSKDKPQMLFVLGGPGSGKGTQSAKLVRDLKYAHLSVGDLMRAEVKNKSKEGQEIESIQARGDLVPAELTVKILVKAIKAKNAKKYIIDGFPRNLDQALHFEKTYREIDFILNLHCPDEVLLDRLLKRAATEGRSDDNPETIKNRLRQFHEQTEQAIEFYSRYGKVVHVSGEGPIDQVYQRVLHAVEPNLIFFYGPPASGQEQLAEQFSHLTGYNLLRVQDFYRAQGLQNATDEVKMDQLIAFLRDHHLRNFLLHGFPENIRQVKIFVEHFAAPKQFYYFDFTKDQVENNIKNRTKQQRQDILQEYENYVKNRKDILPYFSKKPYFVRVQESDSKEKIWNNLVKIISPEVIACPDIPDDELSVGFIQRIERERGYLYVDFNALVRDETRRGLELGKRLESVGNISAKIELLKRVLYTDFSRKRFIIGGFPSTVNELNEFEAQCCKVRNVLVFVHKEANLKGGNIYAHFHTQGKLIKIKGNNIDQFDDYVQERCRYGFLLGAELAGRPIIANYLKTKFATQLIDWNQVTEMLKVKLSTEENPDYEVKFSDVQTYFQNEIATKDRSNNILFDGWPYEKDQLVSFVKTVGIPNYVFYLNASEETLSKKYMIENKAEAVDEGDLEKIKEEIARSKLLASAFHEVIAEGNNINLFDIAVGISTEATLKDINKIIYKKVLVFRNLSQNHSGPELKNHMINACINNGVIFIDVAQLVKERIALNDDLGQKLQAQSKMAGIASEGLLNPSLFTPKIITDLITKSLEAQPSAKYLMIYNYPSAESKQGGDFFPRAIDELYQIEVSVGPVKQIISIQDSPEDYVISDPFEEKPVVEEPVVETKAPKAEGEEGEAEEPPKQEEEEGEETKPKFDPNNFTWTVSNANPKSLAKIFHRRPNCQHVQQELDSKNLDELSNLLRESLARFEQGEPVEKDYYVEIILS